MHNDTYTVLKTKAKAFLAVGNDWISPEKSEESLGQFIKKASPEKYAYLAEASPGTVLDLITELEKTRQACDWLARGYANALMDPVHALHMLNLTNRISPPDSHELMQCAIRAVENSN